MLALGLLAVGVCADVPAAAGSGERGAEEPGAIRIRLREHFDVSRIHWGGPDVVQAYYGATNTVNLWWEEPGRYALGLAFNPVLSSGYSAIGSKDPLVDDRVKMFLMGVEGKWHPLRQSRFGLFLRGGLYGTLLRVADAFGGDRWGASYYVAVGWEVPLFAGRIGVAPDVGFRHSILERDTQVFSFSPSISVSLYFLSDFLTGRSKTIW